ncbi:MAG: substrate-binding domain-containing protein, partial [Oscillospiraceae bacterium]|nr:substrate-binding domain-containing protein [Oscillospiraceae bacterium]
KVKCKNALNGRMVELLQEGEADLAVIHAPFDSSSVTVIREIDRNYECLVGSQRFRSLAARPRTVQELAEYPFISMPSGSSSREYIESYFQRGGVRFEPDIELTTVELAIQAVSGGFGIGTLPERLIADRIASGELCRIDLTDPLPPRRVCLISGKNSDLSLTAQAFVNECLPEVGA